MKKILSFSMSKIIYAFCIFNITYLFFFADLKQAYTMYLACVLLLSCLIVATSLFSLDAHNSALLCTIGCMNGGSFLFLTLNLLLLNFRFSWPLTDEVYTEFFNCFIIFIMLFCIATILVFKYFNHPHKRKFICNIYLLGTLIVFTIHQTITPFNITNNLFALPILYYIILCIILCFLMLCMAYHIGDTKNLFVQKANRKIFFYLLTLSMLIIIGFVLSLYTGIKYAYLYMIYQLTLMVAFFKLVSQDSIIQYSKDLTQKLELYNESTTLMNHYLQHMSEENESIQKQFQYVDTLYSQMMFFYPNALFVIVDHNIYHSNEHGRILLKASDTQDILYTPFMNYIAIEDRDLVEQIIQSLYKHAQEHATIEIKMNTSTSEQVDVELYLTLSHANEPRAIIASAKDISYKKHQDKLQQDIALEKLKLEFFCTISHELKTPVNIIYSATQLQNNLITQGEYDKISTYNTMINQNCMRLLRLLNNFLDINRIESHFFNVSKRTINIVDLTENILGSTLSYMERKNISALFDTEEEEIFCTIDTDLLERSLLNLLSNAIKYTPEGGHIDVFITAENNQACIHIKDTGVGIPPESQKVIFERFTRIENGLIRKAEGAGIGLSLVKSFVELNNGIIEVSSVVNEGTEFIIRLPIEINFAHLMDSNYIHTLHSEKVDIEFSDVYLN